MSSSTRTAERRSDAAIPVAPLGHGTPLLSAVGPVDTLPNFKQQAYAALKNVIVSMDIYRSRSEIRLDERRLASVGGFSSFLPISPESSTVTIGDEVTGAASSQSTV